MDSGPGLPITAVLGKFSCIEFIEEVSMKMMRREEGSSPLKKAQSGGCGPSSGLDKQKES